LPKEDHHLTVKDDTIIRIVSVVSVKGVAHVRVPDEKKGLEVFRFKNLSNGSISGFPFGCRKCHAVLTPFSEGFFPYEIEKISCGD
jgi:hypothetical protein